MPTVDTDRVVAMLELGAPTSLIADRLGCTARHVRRIRAAEDVDHEECWAWGTEWERDLIWSPLLEVGLSPSRVAHHVGRTPQAVHQWRKEERARTVKEQSADPDNWHAGPQ
jgi:predicted transcriptional regulator